MKPESQQVFQWTFSTGFSFLFLRSKKWVVASLIQSIVLDVVRNVVPNETLQLNTSLKSWNMLFVFCCGISIDVFFWIQIFKVGGKCESRKTIALICCRHRLRVCSRKYSWDEKMSCVSPARGWNATLTMPLNCFYWPPDDHNAETGFGWTARLLSGLWSGDKWRLQWCRLLRNVQNKFALFFVSYCGILTNMKSIFIEKCVVTVFV